MATPSTDRGLKAHQYHSRRMDQLFAEQQARQNFMKGYLGRVNFGVILSWAGWNGLDIVEELERLEPLAEPFIGREARKFIIDSNGDLCSIQWS